MDNVSTVIPCYAADTSGVCSAMYELGGLTVVHDASGCNSTYSTHDEPRWYDKKSMIYISALTEIDAIMGNDEKLIADTAAAAKDLDPRFITVCGSPMPMMTGVDFDAVAAQIEERSGKRCFGMHTNGTHSYIKGASEAFKAIVSEYVKPCEKTAGASVNILGATPLDFGLCGTVESIKSWLEERGIEVVSCLAMGSTLEDIARAASAGVNLVISYSGYGAAKLMAKKFGIPFVCGLPIGQKHREKLFALIEKLAEGGEAKGSHCLTGRENSEIAVIGESICAGAIATALKLDCGVNARVISTLETSGHFLLSGDDIELSAEEDIREYLADNNIKHVIADPFYRYVLPKGCTLYSLPHFAFSGRCFAKDMKDLISIDPSEFLSANQGYGDSGPKQK